MRPGPRRNAAPGQRQALVTESTLFVSARAVPWAVAEATARGARPLAKRPCSLLAKRACSLLAKQLCSPARGKADLPTARSAPTANAACGGGVCACACATPGASATDACASGSSTAHPGTDPDCSRASRTTSRPRATVPSIGNAIDPCAASSVHLARIAAKLSPFITSQIPPLSRHLLPRPSPRLSLGPSPTGTPRCVTVALTCTRVRTARWAGASGKLAVGPSATSTD